METVPECFNYRWLKVERKKKNLFSFALGGKRGDRAGMPFGAADAMCENALQSGPKEGGGGRS